MSLQSFQGISAKSVSMQKCGSSCACVHSTISSVEKGLQQSIIHCPIMGPKLICLMPWHCSRLSILHTCALYS